MSSAVGGEIARTALRSGHPLPSVSGRSRSSPSRSPARAVDRGQAPVGQIDDRPIPHRGAVRGADAHAGRKIEMANYDQDAARRLMAANTGMNARPSLRPRRLTSDADPANVTDSRSASLAAVAHLELAVYPGSGKSDLLRHLMVHRFSMGHDVFATDIIRGGVGYPSLPAAAS